MEKKKESRKKLIISIGIIVGILILFYIIYSVLGKISGETIGLDSDSGLEFAKCLSENNVKMYEAYWCPHCVNNKALFGEEGKILVDLDIYVECDEGGENPQSELCYEKGIEGYPTWEISNKLYSGEMSLNKIAELSGCSL